MNNLTPVFAASGVEFLVVLLLMAASAIFNWLQKKKNDENEWSDVEKPRPSAPKPNAPATSWEEELRRILEGQTPTPPAPKPPPVPTPARPVPPVAPRKHPAPPRIPPPTVVSVPPPVRTYRGHCEHCAGHIEFPSNMMGEDIMCPHCYQQTRLNPFTETRVERRAHPPATTPSARISTATTHDAERPAISQPSNQSAHHARTPERTAEVRKVISLFKNPQTARQAIIASVILGPPKSLEP